jgi:ABC-type nitrate/sulfonate/bicarbonate transport system substrate-binding protein
MGQWRMASSLLICLDQPVMRINHRSRRVFISLAGLCRRYNPSAVAVAALLASGILPGAGRAETKIVAGIVAHGTSQWPQYIAQELGWFKQRGLILDMVSVGSGGAQQLATGAIDISHSGFPEFIRASNQGAHVKMVINDISVPPYAVFAKPVIKGIADLRGKTISIGGIKDVTLIYIKPLLASAGLAASDVDFVYAKAAGDRFAALAGGAVDAAILNPPSSLRAGQQGFTNLGEIRTYLNDFPFTVWAVNTDWAAGNKPALVNFAKIYLEGVRWLYDPGNKHRAVEILLKYARQSQKDAADSYDYYFSTLKGFSRDGLLSDKAYARMTEGLIELGDLSPPAPPASKFFDDGFVRQAAAQAQ